MAVSDLATLAAVKAWLGNSTTSSDAALGALISSVSRAILSLLQRPSILPTAYSETLDGNGGSRLLLRNYPVVSISAVTLGTMSVQAAPSVDGYGYALENVDPTPPGRQASLYFRRGHFWRGAQNVAVSYVAGYQVTEALTVAAGAAHASAPYGAWASDRGVTYAATGASLSAVTGAPAAGQYSVIAGVYAFNAADNGAPVAISYGFIPADLTQACVEWAAFRFKAKDNIGFRSKAIGGQETVAFDTSTAPSVVLDIVQPFRRVVPC